MLKAWTSELAGCREGRWNSERALIFPACVMGRMPGITGAKRIRARIKRRLYLWKEGGIAELVKDIVLTARGGNGGRGRKKDEESVARQYNSKVIHGKVREAVQGATSREGGGLLLLEELSLIHI